MVAKGSHTLHAVRAFTFIYMPALTRCQGGDNIDGSNISIGFRVLGDTKTAPKLAWA